MKREINIEIDKGSGFCFGVVNAIKKAENILDQGTELNCLGDIVHNSMEIGRLEKLGLSTISKDDLNQLQNKTVLLRAHGEPPSTYQLANKNNINIVDATCPVVLRLQRNVNKAYLECLENDGQVVIYGKKGHAEVIGLQGQTNNTAKVIESLEDTKDLLLDKPIYLFSQTTMMTDQFEEIKSYFTLNIIDKSLLKVHNTICKQVSGRIPALREFCKNKELILFVSGKKSSNGKVLFKECLKSNPNSFMVSDVDEIKEEWISKASNIGICGATSTPEWLMHKVAEHIKTNF